MAVFKKIRYQYPWGNTSTIEVDEKAITDCVEEYGEGIIALYAAAFQSLVDYHVFELIENKEFAKLFLEEAKKAVMTTGNFGEGFVSWIAPETILANQNSYINMLNDLEQKLENVAQKLPQLDDAEKFLFFNECKLMVLAFVCWKVVGMEE